MHPGIWSWMHVCHGNMHAHSTCQHIHHVSKRLSCIYVFVEWLHMRLCDFFFVSIVDIFLNEHGLMFLKQFMLWDMIMTIRLWPAYSMHFDDNFWQSVLCTIMISISTIMYIHIFDSKLCSVIAFVSKKRTWIVCRYPVKKKKLNGWRPTVRAVVMRSITQY